MRAVSRCLPLVFVGLALLWGPQAVADAGHQGLKRVRPSDGLVQSVDGKAIYDAYCANCHGTTGRGNGPAARHLSVPVPDLSTITARDGAFNAAHVRSHVMEPDGHRPGEVMTCWREVLAANYHRDQALVNLAVANLVKHVEGLQVVRAAGR